MRSIPSFRRLARAAVLILSCLTFSVAAFGADSYDAATNRLAMASVVVNGATYTNVVITVGSVVSVAGGTPLASFDSYNGSNNQLTIPAILVNGATYTNVVITVGSLVSGGGSGADAGLPPLRQLTLLAGAVDKVGAAWQEDVLVDAVGADARFGSYFTLAADASGNVFVADVLFRVVRRITPDGTVTTFAGTKNGIGGVDGVGSNARFWGPYPIAADAAGNVLVNDGGELRSISPTAEVRTLVCCSGDESIQVLVSGGNGSWLAATLVMYMTTLSTSNALSAGPGSAWPPNHSFAIYRLDQAGKATALLASNGSDETYLRSAFGLGFSVAGVAGDDAGRVVFTLGHAVFELSRDGKHTVLAGQMTISGSADGPGEQALFSSPAGVALDAAGNLYVADKGNHTVRKITRSGYVSTVLGRAGHPGILFGEAPGGLLDPRAVAVVPGGLVIASGHAVLLARP